MITILEDSSPSYRNRTEANIRLSDGTLAFAIDFNTAGEKLTYNLCLKHGKPILRIVLRNPLRCVDEVVEKIFHGYKNTTLKNLISQEMASTRCENTILLKSRSQFTFTVF